MSHRSADTTKVFVGGLPTGTTVDELRSLFAEYGTIADCNIVNRCGFLYFENQQLAFKAIDDLNNFNFKGSRLSVEKGRVKPPSSRNGGRYQGNGFGGRGGGGPMRGSRGRDNFRGPPPYERRGPMRQDNNYLYGGGYDRRPGPGPGSYMEERNRYSDSGYGDAGMYPDDRRTLGERNNSNLMDRRPLMDAQLPPINAGGSYLNMASYDRQPQFDMYNQRDIPSKPMGGYNNIPEDSSYDLAYPPLLQQRGFAGGPGPGPGSGPRRNMPPPRRY